MKRREFIILSSVGATSTALLSACGHPENKLIPALIADNEYVPGLDYWKASACTMCAAGCGIVVRTREHKANKIEGNPLHPVNRGALCARGQAGLQVLYNPDRIRGPLKRTGERGSGQFAEISWDEAIKTLADKLREIKAQNRQKVTGFITGDWRVVTTHIASRFMDAYGAHTFLMSPLFQESYAKIDYNSGNTLNFDIANATYLLSFGARFLETWVSPVMYSLAYGEFRRSTGKTRGKFVHVEPRMSLTAANADEWLPAKADAIGATALAIAQVIVREGLSKTPRASELANALQDFAPEKLSDRIDIPADKLIRIAREFATAERPLAIGSNKHAAFLPMPVYFLNLLVGNRNQKGGVMSIPRNPSGPFATLRPENHLNQYFSLLNQGISRLAPKPSEPQSGLNQQDQSDWLGLLKYHKEGALLIHQSNPLHINPALKEQFNQISFIASFSSFMNETAQMSDLILPDHSYLEIWDIALSDAPDGRAMVTLAQPVISPQFNTMQTADVLLAMSRELGGEVGTALPFSSAADFVKRSTLELAENPGSIKAEKHEDFWKAFIERGVWVGEPLPATASNPSDIIWTLIGHELETEKRLLTEQEAADPEYPLTLMAYEHPTLGEGEFANLPALQELPDPMTSVIWGSWLEINPKTAASLGIADGDLVEVTTRHGSVRAPAVIYPAIRPDVIAMPFGQGHTAFGQYAAGRGANAALLLLPGTHSSFAPSSLAVKVAKIAGDAKLIRFGSDLWQQMETKR